MTNYYQVLGIDESATSAEIKAAFKQKAIQYHPDKNPGQPEMEELFKEVNRAYQVLSNPYEKARYDLQLKYGSVTQQYYEDIPKPSSPPPPPKRPYYRYVKPEVDYRENWIATAYAFGFTFVMAILVMAFIKVKNYYDEQQLAKLLDSRRSTFEVIKTKYAEGDLVGTMTLLYDMGGFYKQEGDMARFKKSLLNQIIYSGQAHFRNSEYTDAIFYYELLDRFANSPLELRENLAIAYKLTDQPEKSVKVFTELMVRGYNNISTYMELGDIHENQLAEYDMASGYYEKAKDLAIDYYKSMYGDGYILALHDGNVPLLHYNLYIRLAKIHLKTGNPQKAINVTRWNIQIWPDSAINYAIAGSGYEALNDLENACESFSMANSLDQENSIPVYCQ